MRVVAAILFALSCVAPVAAQEATPVPAAPIERAAEWLLTQRTEDGAFIGFDGKPDAGVTADAIIALAAARGAGVSVDLAPSVAFLEQNALVYAQTGAGQAAKLVLAVVAAGGDPRDVAGVDPVSLIEHARDDQSGLYGLGVFDHALVMLAMVAAGVDVPADAVSVLRKLQLDDGSWSWDAGASGDAGDTNTTAVVIQALVAAGAGDAKAVTKGLDYLRQAQLERGGFPYQPNDGATADANSTGIVLMALVAAGNDPSSSEWRDAAGALLAFQNDSGAFRYNDETPADNLYATLQALPAIAVLTFPTATPTAA